jgi:hypothetical protein
MACECGEKYQRVYPAKNSFSIYLSVNPVSKLDWNRDKIFFCISCGDISSDMPVEILQALRDADPEFQS